MDEATLYYIWSRLDAGAHPYIAEINRETGAFREQPLSRMRQSTLTQAPHTDLFFTPLGFRGDRKNENVVRPTVLFADLDGWFSNRAMQEKIAILPPAFLWATSDHNAQAVWRLTDAPHYYEEWADMNQRLTYWLGADKGGWHGSKLLRVPATQNWKYDPPQLGFVMQCRPHIQVSAEALLADLPPVRDKSIVPDTDHPGVMGNSEWRTYVRGMWDRLPLGVQSDLTTPRKRDRSMAMVLFVNACKRAGLTSEETFHLSWGLPWNKWRTDRYRPDYLWQIINQSS